VHPFILRGVSLIGVSSVQMPMERRLSAWARLAGELPMEVLDRLTQTARLDEVPTLSQKMIDGQTRGRIVIDVNG